MGMRGGYSCAGTILIVTVFWAIPALPADDLNDVHEVAVQQILNTCLVGRNHKSVPGPEDSLHSQCSPWANRSCCNTKTALDVHYEKMYKFDWSHCVEPLSAQCRKHFRQDLCFYECSPNVGPWLVKVQQKIRNQRFINVPLCRSDCEAWYADCRDDFTCTDNWGLNFKWTADGNKCPTGSTCRPFRQIYQSNATYFCETVWDHSWKVVDDSEHCMRLWFNPERGNPNDAVAKWKAEEIVTSQMQLSSGSKLHNELVPLLIVALPFLTTIWRCM